MTKYGLRLRTSSERARTSDSGELAAGRPRFSRTLVATAWLLAIATFSITFPATSSLADGHGKIRMYKLNSKGQEINQLWVKKPRAEKCVTAIRNRKVSQFAQTGFAWCQIFSEKDCAEGSEVPAMWGGKRYRVADIDIEQPQVRLLRGSEWMLSEDSNVEIRSWFCSYRANG